MSVIFFLQVLNPMLDLRLEFLSWSDVFYRSMFAKIHCDTPEEVWWARKFAKKQLKSAQTITALFLQIGGEALMSGDWLI